MVDLPYIEPSEELSINLGALTILLQELAITKRGKHVLNIERLQIFFYLALKPEIMNRILSEASKPTALLREDEYFTASTTGFNMDPLYDRKKIKMLLQILAAKSLLKISYDKNDGFLFELNQSGVSFSEDLKQIYFEDVRRIASHLKHLQSTSTNNLNKYINNLIRGES